MTRSALKNLRRAYNTVVSRLGLLEEAAQRWSGESGEVAMPTTRALEACAQAAEDEARQLQSLQPSPTVRPGFVYGGVGVSKKLAEQVDGPGRTNDLREEVGFWSAVTEILREGGFDDLYEAQTRYFREALRMEGYAHEAGVRLEADCCDPTLFL